LELLTISFFPERLSQQKFNLRLVILDKRALTHAIVFQHFDENSRGALPGAAISCSQARGKHLRKKV